MLVGKPKGKGPLGRLMHRWEDNIGMDLREIWLGRCGLDESGIPLCMYVIFVLNLLRTTRLEKGCNRGQNFEV